MCTVRIIHQQRDIIPTADGRKAGDIRQHPEIIRAGHIYCRDTVPLPAQDSLHIFRMYPACQMLPGILPRENPYRLQIQQSHPLHRTAVQDPSRQDFPFARRSVQAGQTKHRQDTQRTAASRKKGMGRSQYLRGLLFCL